MEESWRGADHTQTSWGAADRCHESTAVIGTARMEGGEAGTERQGGKKVGVGEGKWRSRLQRGGNAMRNVKMRKLLERDEPRESGINYQRTEKRNI